jgi:hypothetical protein
LTKRKKQLGSAGILPTQVAVKQVRGITTTTERATLSAAISETNATPSIVPIIFSIALGDQFHFLCVRQSSKGALDEHELV